MKTITRAADLAHSTGKALSTRPGILSAYVAAGVLTVATVLDVVVGR